MAVLIMDDCIFCKIVSGEVPSEKVYESENVFAFLDMAPFVKGHLLAVPKKHSRWLWGMSDEDYSVFMNDVRKLAEVLKRAFNTDWVEMVVAGMGVEHIHVHLLPRRDDDGLGEVPIKSLDPKPSEEEMKEIVGKIRMALGSASQFTFMSR